MQDGIEDVCKQINAEVCKWLHPRRPPCRFWNKKYGAVPDAVSRVPINNDILCADYLVWPPEPGPELGGSLRTRRVACPEVVGQHCAAHGVDMMCNKRQKLCPTLNKPLMHPTLALPRLKTKCPANAGGPSGEPPAKPRVMLFDHAVVKTVLQAKEKLAYIEQQEKEAKDDLKAKVGVALSSACQRSTLSRVCTLAMINDVNRYNLCRARNEREASS